MESQTAAQMAAHRRIATQKALIAAHVASARRAVDNLELALKTKDYEVVRPKSHALYTVADLIERCLDQWLGGEIEIDLDKTLRESVERETAVDQATWDEGGRVR
jgi:hypothetical protein